VHIAIYVGLVLGLCSPAPAQQSDVASRLLSHERYEWQLARTPHFDIHYPRYSYASSRLEIIRQRLVDARTLALAHLGVSDYERRVDVFYVDPRQDVLDLIGTRATGLANTEWHFVILVYNPLGDAFDRHEILHVYHENVWGGESQPIDWFREGFSTQTHGYCGPYTVGEMTSFLLKNNLLSPLEETIFSFGEQNEIVRNHQSASLPAYLFARYREDSVRQLWT